MKSNWPALVILILYLTVGTLYAIYTPRWQAPDEPAHYNYVRALAEGEGFPRMEAGDYDQDYLSRLTSERFPPELSIDPLRYEDHQPPLYYLLATPVYWISGGAVLALRLFSLLLGGVAVVMVMLILREFWTERPGIAWLGGGLVALVPQYVAMTAAINNDALMLALLWAWLWLALRYLRHRTAPWALGGVLGALLLTKATGYGALVLAVLAVLLRARREGQPFRWTFKQLALVLLPALALGGLWWARNAVVYGWPDVMGQMRHGAVVQGQPRTAAWIAREGLWPFLTGALRTTFRSFWGQFGWMGVVVDARIYQGLAIFSGLVLWGGTWRLAEAFDGKMDARQRDGLILLGTSAALTLAIFVIYNFTYVQHQGRYLFAALPLLALSAALGLERLLERKLAVGTALFMLAALIVMGVAGLIRGDLPLWPMAMVGAALVALPAASYVPERWQGALAGALLAAFAALDLWCLFGFIVPMLT